MTQSVTCILNVSKSDEAEEKREQKHASRVNRVSRAAFHWLPSGGNRNNTHIVEIQTAVIQKYRGKRKLNLLLRGLWGNWKILRNMKTRLGRNASEFYSLINRKVPAVGKIHSERKEVLTSKDILFQNDDIGSSRNTYESVFIGPRCPWGPIYGSGSLSLTDWVSLRPFAN